MSVLPIVARELALACRRPSTYWTRSGAGLIAAVIALAMLITGRQAPVQIGHQIFSILSGLALAYALLSGVRCTADSISQEKRDGTLGLLLLTDLRGYDVVLGKMAVNSLDAAYGLVAVAPILAVPVLLGSVTGSEFWRMNLLLLNVLVFSLVLGLIISTFGREERNVMAVTLVMLLFLSFGLPLCWKAGTRVTGAAWLDWVFLLPSPVYAFTTVSDSALRVASGEYWSSMATLAGLWAVGLVISSLLLHHVWQQKGDGSRAERWRCLLRRLRFGTAAETGRTEGVLDRQPYLWLITRDRMPGICLVTLFLLMIAFVVWLPSGLQPPRSPATPIAVFTSLGLHILTKLLFASEAARHLNEQKRSGFLELLLSTPLGVGAMLRAQRMALGRLFALPFAGLLLMNMTLMTNSRTNTDEVPVIFGGAVIAIFDLVALSWVGMLAGLRERRYGRAVLRSFAGVMFLPWAVVLLFMFTLANRAVPTSTVRSFFLMWYVGVAVYDILLATWAQEQLRKRFFQLAANDFPPPTALQPRQLSLAGAARAHVSG